MSNSIFPVRPQTTGGGSRLAWPRVAFTACMALLAASVVMASIEMWRDRSGKEALPAAVAAGKGTVGTDLHAVAVAGDRRFVSGHAGAAYSDRDGVWAAVKGLEGKDAMGWASLPGRTLVGGHHGLYLSTDGGVTFAGAQVNLPVVDIHALGGSERTIYLASPKAGLFASTDSGETFTQRSVAGGSLVGIMLVDPGNPDRAIAPDLAAQVVETVDGGRTWRSLGGPRSPASVAWDPRNRDRLAAVGADGVMISADAGRSWRGINAPAGTAAVTFDSQGHLLAATLVADQARLHRSSDSGATWLAA